MGFYSSGNWTFRRDSVRRIQLGTEDRKSNESIPKWWNIFFQFNSVKSFCSSQVFCCIILRKNTKLSEFSARIMIAGGNKHFCTCQLYECSLLKKITPYCIFKIFFPGQIRRPNGIQQDFSMNNKLFCMHYKKVLIWQQLSIYSFAQVYSEKLLKLCISNRWKSRLRK